MKILFCILCLCFSKLAFAQSAADYVTKRAGGERAVAEACIHIIDKFFEPLDLDRFIEDEHKISEWKT